MMLHIASSSSQSSATNVEQKDIQPNAIDLKIAKVFKIHSSLFTISEETKKHRVTTEIEPIDSHWLLYPGHYEVVMENQVKIENDEAGWLIARSTLNRNGVFITSGLYDSGFHGAAAGVMHVTCGPVSIEKGTRVAQFLLFKASSLGVYDGDYGINVDGTIKQMELKYT